MIKIEKPSVGGECNACGRVDDVYAVSVGKNINKCTAILLCPACRKQMSNMLTKRVK